MASLPSPSQVAGPHYQIYDAYYLQLDSSNTGRIGAMDAARILKKSKLSDIVLSKIWDLSDPHGQGYLTRDGFFVALKLCALAQSGRGISMDNILANDAPVPKLGDLPKISNKINDSSSNVDWSIKPPEKAKYDQLFESLQPANGVLPGAKVRGVLMESKLPIDMLGRIWDLADLDRDGSLSRHEFMIAMHLVYKALEKHPIPATLPAELMPPGRRKESVPSPTTFQSPKAPVPSRPPPPPSIGNVVPAKPPQPLVVTEQPMAFATFPPPQPNPPVSLPVVQPLLQNNLGSGPPTAKADWVVSKEEKAQYDMLFATTDSDMDGFVSGSEIKDVFLKSGVPQSILARIWALCDTSQSGKLNNEQFALAMWLIKRQLEGIEPPAALTPNMIPPSLKTQPIMEPKVEPTPVIPAYSNPELEMIAAEIRELTNEKLALESDIMTKEAELRLRETEVRNLQSEFDTLAATLRQLETQKGEAQKRLNDLSSQKNNLELELAEVVAEVDAEQAVVDKLRSQADEQEESLKSQESEVHSKKQELENLKLEEQRLEKQQLENQALLESLIEQLQDTKLQISQVKSKVNELEEAQRQMNDAIASCDVALEASDPSRVMDAALSLGPVSRDVQIDRLLEDTPTKEEPTKAFNGFDADFDRNDAFTNSSAFENADPFGPPAPLSNKPVHDPFDPFGDKAASTINAKTPIENEDPFGCDPFANLHAPPRPSSTPIVHPPSAASTGPALPPKKAKQPPPRPAPPRPASGPGGALRAAPAPPTPSPVEDAWGDAKFSSAFASTTSPSSLRTPSSSSATPSPIMSAPQAPFEFTEDPFKNYRYEDVFGISDPFADEVEKTNHHDELSFEAKFPPIETFEGQLNNNRFSDSNGNLGKPRVENFEVAWAKKESLRSEEERRKREEQEQRDWELACKLDEKWNSSNTATTATTTATTTTSNKEHKSGLKQFFRRSHANS